MATWDAIVAVDEGAALESTMRVGCDLGRRAVREACPRFIDRSLRRSSTTSTPSTRRPCPAPLRTTPRTLAPRPTAFTTRHPHHTYRTYLSTTAAAVCFNMNTFPSIFLRKFASIFTLKFQQPKVSQIKLNFSFIAQVLWSNLNQRCWFDAGSTVLRSKGAIKAVYISSRATCKCYLCSLKLNYVINFMC